MKATEDAHLKITISQQVFTTVVQCEAVTGIPRKTLVDEAIEWYVEAWMRRYAEEVPEPAGNA